MKLITFQSMGALNFLNENGYLVCDENYIEKEKTSFAYDWIIDKMNNNITNKDNIKYPIWCWVKCNRSICPPKHKGDKIEGFDVKITFNKKEEDVFITDFRRYSFLLNNRYIPDNMKDKEKFDLILKKYNITDNDLKAFVIKGKHVFPEKEDDFKQVYDRIRKSFDKCITKDSNILQGCVWKIEKSEIESIEILKNDGYVYGSLNYVRADGRRRNWIEEYYKMIN